MLADEFTVVAWDEPGAGRSSDLPEGMTLAAFADGLAALIESLDLGPAHVLHTMSFISPIADDLAVVFKPLMPVPLVELLLARAIRTIPVTEAEYLTMACNVLAVRPGVVVVVDGNPVTRRAMEAHGVEVHSYDGSEISLKGDGGPTCLTRPLWRSA